MKFPLFQKRRNGVANSCDEKSSGREREDLSGLHSRSRLRQVVGEAALASASTTEMATPTAAAADSMILAIVPSLSGQPCRVSPSDVSR